MDNKSLNIVYLTHARLPTQKAHGLATVKLCEAFSTQGAKVLLLHAGGLKDKNTFEFYNIKNNFKEKILPSIDLVYLGIFKKLFFLIHVFTFSVVSALYIIFNHKKYKDSVFFSHNHSVLFFLTFFSYKTFFDVHDFPSVISTVQRVVNKSFGFSVQTKWKVGALSKKFGIPQEKIIYWPNGIDLNDFNITQDKLEAREKLFLPKNEKIILYTGQLFSWKGVDTLIRAAGVLNAGSSIYIVGGSDEDVIKLKKQIPDADYSRIKFISFQPHNLIPLWQKAADVLVLPNTAKEDISLYYTSPMKLFEYMASGRPIVASRIPSITEILNETNAYLAEADNPSSFVEKINFALLNTADSDKIAKVARTEVGQYTWDRRALKISSLLKKAS